MSADLPYVEISADPDVEGFEITGVDGTEELYRMIDEAGGSLWFMLAPAANEDDA